MPMSTQDRPATVIAGANFRADRERANLVFDSWNEALAQRARILRSYLRGQDIHREWIDKAFQMEVDAGWSEEKEQEIRQLIESIQAAPAERERPLRSWWRDWGQAARYPWRTRVLLAVSFAFFGLIFGAPLGHPHTAWPVLLAVLLGALVGLALAEYGIHASRTTKAASEDGDVH
jgi:hypothetical protein